MATKDIRLHLRTGVITLIAAALLGAAGGVLALMSGSYNVSALRQHYALVHAFFEFGLRASVQRHAKDVQVPVLSKQMVRQGAQVYARACAHCHGGPGVAPGDWGKSMQPAPGPLVDAARRWTAAELYWLTRNGIRMTGMPAWEYHLSENELWAVTAFLHQMPALSAGGYRELTAVAVKPALPAVTEARPVNAGTVVVGDPVRGKIAATQYACQGCHIIPGVVGARVYIGQPLADVAKRKLLAGRLPYSQANLVRWLMDPQAIDPATAMPNMGVSERDARDIAAYLLEQ